jgi:hypothetical protein
MTKSFKWTEILDSIINEFNDLSKNDYNKTNSWKSHLNSQIVKVF